MYLREYDPLYFRRGHGLPARFDDPEGRYGVLYVAQERMGAFIETFGRKPGKRRFFSSQLASRRLATVGARRDLRLVDFRGDGLPQLGATAEVTSGPYDLSRAWSRALYEHPREPDGICYRLKHAPGRAGVAIFDRAEGDVAVHERDIRLEDDIEFRRELRKAFGFLIVD